VWAEAASVVCVLCDTVVAQSPALLRQHVAGVSHKKALAGATSDDGTVSPPEARMAGAVATVGECKARLDIRPDAAQAATLERYQSKSWPPSADAPHLPPVPLLSMRYEAVACYACQTACVTKREFGKKHVPSSACSSETIHTVTVQTLQQGNKTRFFPVTFARAALPAGTVAATSAPPGAPAPASVALPLDVFLGSAGGGRASAGGRPSMAAEVRPENQCGGLMRLFRFAVSIQELNWTAQQVVDEFALVPPPDARRLRVGGSAPSPLPGRGGGDAGGGSGVDAAAAAEAKRQEDMWTLFSAIKVALRALYANALQHLRSCDLSIADRLNVNGTSAEHDAGGAAGRRRRPFNPWMRDASVERYANDAALTLYTVVRLVHLGTHSDAERLADGRDVPAFSALTVRAAHQLYSVFTSALARTASDAADAAAAAARAAAATDARGEEDGGGGGDGDDGGDRAAGGGVGGGSAAATATAAANTSTAPDKDIGGVRAFARTVGALLHKLCHETYDPRPPHSGGSGKACADLSMAMPFLALLYPLSSSLSSRGCMRAPTVAYMDARTGQHLASALLFAIRAVNALVFFNQGGGSGGSGSGGRVSLEQAFAHIRGVTDPYSTTAACFAVTFYARAEKISRAEEVPPVFVPCEDPEHVAGGPPSAVCGTLIDRGFHLGTMQLGRLVEQLQAKLWRLFSALTWGYDPAGCGFFGAGRQLVDQPSVNRVGESFLDLPVNRTIVREWQSHLLASGVLDDLDCPVRPAFKDVAAGGGGVVRRGPGGGGGGRGGGDGGQPSSTSSPPPTVPEVDPTARPVVVNAARLARWRQDVAQGRACLSALFQATGGASARTSELSGVIVRPTEAGASRNLYVHFGRCYTVITYSKTSSAFSDGGRPIIRWLDAKTSTLVLLQLAFIDPLEAYFATADKDQRLDQSLLFRDAHGAELPHQKLAAALSSDLLGGVADFFTGPRLYRQWTAAAAKHVTKVDILSADASGAGGGGSAATARVGGAGSSEGAGETDWGRVLELQSGHTPTTASSAYAGDPRLSVANVNNAQFWLYLSASNKWQGGLGVVPRHGADGLCHPLQPRMSASGRAATCAPSAAGGAAAAAAAAGGTTSTLTRAAGPPPGVEVGVAVAGAPAAAAGLGTTTLQLARRYRLDPAAVSQIADAKVRSTFGAGMYRSRAQQRAIYAVMSATDAVTQLVVLPTAGGKTATFLIPVACEADAAVAAAAAASTEAAATTSFAGGGSSGSGGTNNNTIASATSWNPPVTIVLTPTRAITANTIAAATAAGVTVGEWPRGCHAGEASLFVIDIGTIVLNRAVFLELIRYLSAVGRLARVVIDEVHLVSLWVLFREILALIRAVLASLSCPLLLLSATVPPKMYDTLLAGVGSAPDRAVAVIRPSTTRRVHIRYRVEPVVARYRRPVTGVPDGDRNRELHSEVATRVLRQAASVRNPGGDKAGRSTVLGVFCETVAEVDGIVTQLYAHLAMLGLGLPAAASEEAAPSPSDLDDIVILKFHSQGAAADGSTAAEGGAGGGRGWEPQLKSLHTSARVTGLTIEQLERPQLQQEEQQHERPSCSSRRRRPPPVSVAGVVTKALKQPGVGIVIVVGSPAVSTGTDFVNMSWAVFLGPRHLLSFAQASGRLCRDGSSVATALVLCPEGYTRPIDEDASLIPNLSAVGDAVKFAEWPPTCCRRKLIDATFDGVAAEDFVSCRQGGFAQCDFCSGDYVAAVPTRPTANLPARRRRPEDDGGCGDGDGGGGGGGGGGQHGAPPASDAAGDDDGDGWSLLPPLAKRARATAVAPGDGVGARVTPPPPHPPPQPLSERPTSLQNVVRPAPLRRRPSQFLAGGSPTVQQPTGLSRPPSSSWQGSSVGTGGAPSLRRSLIGAATGGGGDGSRGVVFATTPPQELSQLTLSPPRPPRPGDAPRPSTASATAAADASRQDQLAAPGAVGACDRALAYGQVVEAATQVGLRAARAIWDSSRGDQGRPPCAWCRAQPVAPLRTSHALTECFVGICCSCLKPSGGHGPPGGRGRPDECSHTSSQQCRRQRLPWTQGGATPLGGKRCKGCTMLITMPAGEHGLISLHGDKDYGTFKCRWLYVIRVAMLQAMMARRVMSPMQPDFIKALQETCCVDWMTMPPSASGSGNVGEQPMALRTPPMELLSWGPNVRVAHSVDDFGEWLTAGARLPNVVLFAPVVAQAMHLSF